ncbi:MAG TPA: hypothetical protein VMY18_03905, partial [Acidobacteriota bacterium]|nr:hypothetical protein [Acidobacteriota bacterium]
MSSIQRLFIGPVFDYLYRNRFLAFVITSLFLGLCFIGQRFPFGRYEKALVALMALFGVGCLIAMALLWPSSGLLILLAAGLLVGLEIGTGTKTNLNPAFLLVPLLILTWLVVNFIFRKKIPQLKTRAILPLLLLAAVAILSFLQGQFAWFPISGAPMRAQVAGLSIFLFSIGAFLLAACQMTDLRWLKRLTWLFLGIGVVLILGRVFSLGDMIGWFPGGARGTTGSLFWTWFVALAFGQAVSNRKLHLIFRLGIILFTLATMGYAMTSTRQAWVSGWLPPLIAMVAILYAIYPRVGTIIILSVGMLTIVFGLAFLEPLMAQEQYSLLTRLEAWRIVVQMSQGSLLLGFGPANYYYYTELQSILGWHVRFSSHNQYVDILAQVGI